MSGHGHVTPHADGSKARCGGPGVCAACSVEAASAEIARDQRAQEAQARLARLDALNGPVPQGSPTLEELLRAQVTALLNLGFMPNAIKDALSKQITELHNTYW